MRYSGLNLDTTVTGELRVATEPSASANATGTLRLAGTYDAYGQKLELDRGQLLFSGPLDNPGLDVRALRRLETTDFVGGATEVGVELTGTLKAPRTRVFSTPAMSEADALSYLLFGRPTSGTSAGMGTEEDFDAANGRADSRFTAGAAGRAAARQHARAWTSSPCSRRRRTPAR